VTSPDLRIAGISCFRGGRAEWQGGNASPERSGVAWPYAVLSVNARRPHMST
jgi:hypothetical protein